MKTYGGVDVQTQVFFTSALDGGEWLASRASCVNPGERTPGTHWIRGLVGPRICLDDMDSNSDPLVVQLVASHSTDYAIPALTQ
jgi:hypothetical protein